MTVARRLFSLGGELDDRISASSVWCRELFPVALALLDILAETTREEALPDDASPCLELPEQAWDTPGDHGLETRQRSPSACSLERRRLPPLTSFHDGSILDRSESPMM